MQRIVLASSNPGKLAEIRELFVGIDIELIAQSELGIADADETGPTFVENALLKARHAARLSGLPALGDDSGICVDALDGGPGLYSARYAGAHGDSAAISPSCSRHCAMLPTRNARRIFARWCCCAMQTIPRP